MLLWLWSWTGTVLEQWCEVLVFKLNCFRDYFIWTWFVITLNRTLMYDVVFVNWCNMWHVCLIMYDLGCMLTVNRDPSWYSKDYRVYIGSSMIVWPLTDCHCTCALINWTVLLQSHSLYVITCDVDYIHAYACDHVWPMQVMVVRSKNTLYMSRMVNGTMFVFMTWANFASKS